AGVVAGIDCYARFAQVGLDYGPGHQALQTVYLGERMALARLQLPASVADSLADYVLHPSLLDAGLQAVATLANAADNRLALPFAVAQVDIVGRCSAQMWALVTEDAADAAVRRYDIALCDDAGTLAVRLSGFATRVVQPQPDGDGVLLLQPQWRAQPTAGAAAAYAQHYVLLCGVGVGAAALHALSGADCLDVAASGELAADYGAAARQLCAQVQAIVRAKPTAPVLLQVVVPADGEGQVLAGLAGLLRTARQEQPMLVGQLIAVAADEDAPGLASRLAANAAAPQDAAIRYREGERQVADWQEWPAGLADETPAPAPWKADGVYLLTGGLGGLGKLLALDMARRAPGVTLVLTGRRHADAAAQQHLAALAALGATVAYRVLDVADRQAVRQLLLEVFEQYAALHGIVHAAGVLRDSLLLNKRADEIDAVLAPKVAGLRNLDEASRDIALDWLICFSSTSAALGNVGQADYATANGFMDSYAHYRNALVAQGLRQGRTVALNWPLWQAGGMRASMTPARSGSRG
ncbi:SDR family oxidoreductase, partial [Janthinobacterium sp.]|uniref:SDR family oxidoreductase n=1 Tax=Janthinobacterium sp. TaxID=1871054 RepID=UPI002587661F